LGIALEIKMASTSGQHADDSDVSFAFTSPNNTSGSGHGFSDGGFTDLSSALLAAQTTPYTIDTQWPNDVGFDWISNDSTTLSSPLTLGTPLTGPKVGSRFSKEVIRILKNWLATHQQHPYPREADMEKLQERTGLNPAQLANWFANARRRGKAHGIRPASPQVRITTTSPVDIIQRPNTPAIRQDSRIKNPMQRWVDSPPEHEPANVDDIARAMASGSKNDSSKFHQE
jgi:hypothetical protein